MEAYVVPIVEHYISRCIMVSGLIREMYSTKYREIPQEIRHRKSVF